MENITFNPGSLFNSRQYGFSQVVVAEPGRMVFVSGQVGWDKDENIMGKNDLETQTEKALNTLSLAMESAGGKLEHITMLRIYKVNYQPEDGPVISSALRKTFGTENPPASTWISVAGLASEDFLIEIEAQGVI